MSRPAATWVPEHCRRVSWSRIRSGTAGGWRGECLAPRQEAAEIQPPLAKGAGAHQPGRSYPTVGRPAARVPCRRIRRAPGAPPPRQMPGEVVVLTRIVPRSGKPTELDYVLKAVQTLSGGELA